jgi:uncharacterized protein YodC (DUF2158 family)
MAKFNSGDTVMLKSGGPLMTVEQYVKTQDAHLVRCVWFDGNTEKYGAFPEATLEKTDTDELEIK